jgi:hypothetical protein
MILVNARIHTFVNEYSIYFMTFEPTGRIESREMSEQFDCGTILKEGNFTIDCHCPISCILGIVGGWKQLIIIIVQIAASTKPH